ncbi:MAG: DUF4097 family beta strand repeat-containing protein [Terriglobia bacterium]
MSGIGYRRGSIFWALTLIGVGGIFLYHNFNPSLRPWQIIAKYWPILIIFWGLSKLIDYLQSQAHPETTPVPLFSGSEVVLLLLILALGTLVSKIVLNPWHRWPAAVGIDVDDDFGNLFGESYTYTKTVSQAVKSPTGLIVVVRRGDVEIHASDQNTIEAVVKETVRSPNEDDAKKTSNDLKYSIIEQAGRYLLQTNLDSLPDNGRNIRTDFTLTVPRALSAEITTERGDVTLDGLKGEQTITAKHGDLHVSNVEGMVRAHKSGGSADFRDIKGNVDIDGRGRDVEASNVTGTVAVNGEFSGSVQFQNVAQTLRFNSSRTDLTVQKLSGRLNMELGSLDANGVDGPFEVATKQKDISLEEFKHSVKISTSNGGVRLQTSTPLTQPVNVDVNKGEIELAIPPKSNFQVDARSRHGNVECEFAGLNVNEDGDTPSITGAYGKGGPTLRLANSYGTIHLRKEEGGPPPPPAGTHPQVTPTPPAPAAPPAPPKGKATSTHLRRAHPPADFPGDGV